MSAGVKFSHFKHPGRFGGKWPPGLLERENNNKAESFFDLNLMATMAWMTNKVLEWGIKTQWRRILLDEKHKNFIAAERKWEMLAATNVKMSNSEK